MVYISDSICDQHFVAIVFVRLEDEKSDSDDDATKSVTLLDVLNVLPDENSVEKDFSVAAALHVLAVFTVATKKKVS